MPSLAKSASLVITLAGGLTHTFLTLQLAGSWGTLCALDAESELDAWKLDGLRVLWALLAAYLIAGAFVSFVGFFGVLRNLPKHVRLYRDCSSADLFFTAFLTLLAFLATHTPAPARAACEQPELGPLLALILAYLPAPLASPSPEEACDRALQHAALFALAGLCALTVVRLHFLVAVGAHYRALLRASSSRSSFERGLGFESGLGLGGGVGGGGEQRIRLLPLPHGVAAADVVYAPVHCPAAAESVLGASAEVWVRAGGVEAAAGTSVVGTLVAPVQVYAPTYVNASAPPSPAAPAYAPRYVQSVQAGPTPLPALGVGLEGDAGLLDARVVGTKREWI
ncbi:hypothetical protein C8R47DRAFT_128874 [Mycena vitilis]|nr:hypothetical protein C8R47DRAFT_128874 [Mycena vitilis]